jgi:hypothetical protein
MRAMELHPLCSLFPRMDGAEFGALKLDIMAHGLREPITVHDGMVLDGGNRYRACVELGIQPRIVEFEGDGIVAFVLSANLHRRHMTAGQQAAIVSLAQDWSQAQAHGGDRKTHQTATLPLDSVASRAAQAGASDRTQRMADKVARESPALAQQVAHGEVSLPAAVRQVSAPAERSKSRAKPVAAQDLQARIAELEAENEELRDAASELGEATRALELAGADDPALETKRLLEQVRVVRLERDRLMGENSALVNEVNGLRRKLEARVPA